MWCKKGGKAERGRIVDVFKGRKEEEREGR